jgi:hypothetical protein
MPTRHQNALKCNSEMGVKVRPNKKKYLVSVTACLLACVAGIFLPFFGRFLPSLNFLSIFLCRSLRFTSCYLLTDRSMWAWVQGSLYQNGGLCNISTKNIADMAEKLPAQTRKKIL